MVMQRNARTAFKALEKLGAPVFDHGDREDQWGAHFILSGELRSTDDSYFADYWQEELREYIDETGKIQNPFGIRTDVNDILTANDLYAEWIDGGTCGIYDR